MADAALMTGYLARLGISRTPEPSWPVLCDLVTRHLNTVPFENLDIVAGRRSALTTEDVLHKVVIRRRGGFCYELNEAFGALLVHLGFSLRRIEARVWSPTDAAFGAPFDHLALVVRLPQGEFLTDVGFGDGHRMPLRLPRDEMTDVSGRYTLAQAGELWLLSRPDRPIYQLTLTAQPLAAFSGMHEYHQTSPQSLFAKGLICTRATTTGRLTLSGNRLVRMELGDRTETPVGDVGRALDEYFGLKEDEAC